jgi:hypothetical protein
MFCFYSSRSTDFTFPGIYSFHPRSPLQKIESRIVFDSVVYGQTSDICHLLFVGCRPYSVLRLLTI